MRHAARIAIGLMLAATLMACSRSRTPEDPDVAQGAEAASVALPALAEVPEPARAIAAPGAEIPAGDMVVYACDDGSGVTVTYDQHTALVKLPSGSTMLNRADPPPENGIDAYLGEELSLYRDGNMVQLQVLGKPRICNPS